MKDQESQLIHSFNIAPAEEIRLRLRCYQGVLYFDIRVWFTQDGGKEFFPTKRGVCLPAEHLEDFEKAIRNAHILWTQLSQMESGETASERVKPGNNQPAQRAFKKGATKALGPLQF